MVPVTLETRKAVTMITTVLDALLASIQKAADYNANDTVAPAAILWTDEKKEWERLVPRLRLLLPHFLVFGPYDKANHTGPAIWLRCVLAGKVPELRACEKMGTGTGQAARTPMFSGAQPEPAPIFSQALTWAPGTVPIIYLPGVSRATLRATEDCPNELKPLAELQYRGVFWSQHNGKDWTITAFLQTNHGGLQLKIAKDKATTTSIRRALEKLVDVSVAELQAKSASGELNSNYFDSLIGDVVDDLLLWLSDPSTKGHWESNRWEMLCSRCMASYDFDPTHDGPLVAAENLGLQAKTVWKTAWKRFAAAPSRYAGLIEQLRRAKPKPKAGQTFFPHTRSFGHRTTRPKKSSCGSRS